MVQGKTKCICRKQYPVPESEWIRVPDTHEPIIDRDSFAKAQARLKRLAENAAERTKKPYTPNIFKGKVFCGHCGGSMHRHKGWKRKGEDVYVFNCLSNSRKARGSCVSFVMPEDDLIKTLITSIQAHADAVVGKSLKLRKNAGVIEARREAGKAELAALRMEADRCGRMFKSLYESLVSGIISEDEYREMRESYDAKARESLTAAFELETRQASLDKQIAEYCELSDLLAGAADSGVTERVVDCLVDRIRIFPDRHIEVDFSFKNGFDLISGVMADE
jgi:hypothetical protein